MPPKPKPALPKNPKKEAQRLAKAAALANGEGANGGIAEDADSEEGGIVTPSATPTPPSRTNTPSNSKEAKALAAAAAAASVMVQPPKFKSRPTAEDFPDIVVTCGTNPKKVHPMSKDINIEGLSVTYHGSELIKDSTLNLAYGQRYALVGCEFACLHHLPSQN